MGMSVPLVRLSSLDLVKGFVAVGRRMSITQTADDLCLTQSAVSRQIHALEEQLGVRLLLRKHRGVAFTLEGERLFRSADGAVQQLQDVLGELRPGAAPQTVTITASIGVTGLWLLPRLGRLQREHPDIDVRLSASNEVVDLRGGEIDLEVRYCARGAAPFRISPRTSCSCCTAPSALRNSRSPSAVNATPRCLRSSNLTPSSSSSA